MSHYLNRCWPRSMTWPGLNELTIYHDLSWPKYCCVIGVREITHLGLVIYIENFRQNIFLNENKDIFIYISETVTSSTPPKPNLNKSLTNESCRDEVISCFLNQSLQWRHNGRDSISNHQPRDCLLNRLFRRKSKKTSKLRVTGHCCSASLAIANALVLRLFLH